MREKSTADSAPNADLKELGTLLKELRAAHSRWESYAYLILRANEFRPNVLDMDAATAQMRDHARQMALAIERMGDYLFDMLESEGGDNDNA